MRGLARLQKPSSVGLMVHTAIQYAIHHLPCLHRELSCSCQTSASANSCSLCPGCSLQMIVNAVSVHMNSEHLCIPSQTFVECCLSMPAHSANQQAETGALQGLSNIAWAYAKLGAPLSTDICQLLEGLAVEAASQLLDIRSRRKFIPQNLTNMLYGYELWLRNIQRKLSQLVP